MPVGTGESESGEGDRGRAPKLKNSNMGGTPVLLRGNRGARPGSGLGGEYGRVFWIIARWTGKPYDTLLPSLTKRKKRF